MTFTLENTKRATQVAMCLAGSTGHQFYKNIADPSFELLSELTSLSWEVIYNSPSYELIELSRPHNETREYWTTNGVTQYAQPQGNEMDIKKLIPIDFSRNITPFVVGDVYWNNFLEFELTMDQQEADEFNNADPGSEFNTYFIVSFAGRPNTGKQPVGDDVIVDILFEDTDTHTLTSNNVNWFIRGVLDECGFLIKSWKPNLAAMLKQYQAEQLAEEAKRMDNITMNGNDGEHYEQDHHIALQVEALGDALEPSQDLIDLLHKDVGFSGLDELIRPDDKKDHYRSWDGKENLDIGMAYTAGGGIDCMFIGIHAGIVIGRPIDMSCHNRLYLSTSDKSFCKPIQTVEDKLRDAIMEALSCTSISLDVDNLLASDKFTITLNSE